MTFGSAMTPAYAQITSSAVGNSAQSETQTYTPDYFTQFAPQTAADMVARLPGFDIRGGEGGQRGFGQASLNILINGRRPSSKSSGANQILGRIPANNVTRIEIIDGSTLDIPGLSGQVANIIAKTGEFSGSWEYAVRFEEGSQPQLGDGRVNFSGKTGNLEAVGSLDFGQFIFTEKGDEVFLDGAGQLTQIRDEKVTFNNQRPGANLNLSWMRDNGHIANLNLSARRENENVGVFETFDDQTDRTLSGNSIATNGEDNDRYEIGADYTFPLPMIGQNGQLKLIALHSGENKDFTSRFLFDDGAIGDTRSLFLSSNNEREYIGRAEYSWKTGATSDWTASFETAFNTLDSTNELFVNDVNQSDDFVEVEETRLQGDLSRSWALNDRVNLQTSIGAEYSIIDVKTQDRDAPSFFRPKGLLSASYKLEDGWTLRGQIERSVGQLNFGTFVSSVSLAESTTTRGNDQIKPEQRWETEIGLEKQNPKGLSGRATLFYDIVEDPVEQLLFEEDDGSFTQGPGNLETNAQVYGIRGNVTWVLDDVLKGLRLSADGTIADSRVKDVITDRIRPTNSQTLWSYDVEARWDIPNTAFAIESEVEFTERADRQRIDEIIVNDFKRPLFEVSLIHKDFLGMQWTLKGQNLLDFEFIRGRTIFDETRNGDILRLEETRRQRGRRISIEVTDTF